MAKFSGYNENDTAWDDYHRENGMMTNREFFSSNAKGGFYEGMEYDEDSGEWVPDAETRQREWEREQNQPKCDDCGCQHCVCW
jgi:hypothetical protein